MDPQQRNFLLNDPKCNLEFSTYLGFVKTLKISLQTTYCTYVIGAVGFSVYCLFYDLNIHSHKDIAAPQR